MNLINTISLRYLFGKKSSQAIHWITGISVLGIAVGTAALILVLSVFNGFEDLLSGLFSKYNPDIKIVLKLGKTFEEDSSQIIKLQDIEGVQHIARTLEEVAMFQYKDANEFGLLKGVDRSYMEVCSVHDAVLEGEFQIKNVGTPLANLGSGIAHKLAVNLSEFHEIIQVFIPDDKEEIDPANILRKYTFQAQSIFSFHQESDYSHIITDLNAVRLVLKKPNELSSIDIKCKKGIDIVPVKAQIHQIMGDKFLVKDRYAQDEAFIKIMRLEKWLFYCLFSLTLILVSFTVVGALWMIVIEKRMDISILKSMGMTDLNLKRVFIHLGIIICFFGLLLGSLFAISFYVLQKQFHLIGVPEEFITDSYPIQIRIWDFLLVGLTVTIIACGASLIPGRKITEIRPIFREE